ncbi:tetratricopeptide repeat-containing serine/threonine-protein kinase [Marinoscillum furvescens]|uniref:Serine/threonine protein kinase with TPR repeats n=1 Tax=Marinoscillum furvescens DSM 4134 TaxID=1122208 RepID=A0A3D9L5X4_MARFU|nr:tetratricopeptide repeat-containing serine/threonine-protein kinase [Marinoscillum furvescens]RED99411.1 serine/threonine protein kinase with TPR repeats [Marinoscillum furvescens DSM 4134]
MEEGFSHEEWKAFLNEMGVEEADFPAPPPEVNDYFQQLEKKLSAELSQCLNSELPPAYTIGNYTIDHTLATGGMATVYLASRSDGMYDQKVAIKVLSPILHTDKHLEYFQKERQILARLNHPAIARILDGGVTQEGAPYFIMEYVDGLTLDQHCHQHQPSLRHIAHLFMQIADALAHAHAKLILHRDLKPTNILVKSNGEIKLLDFGIGHALTAKNNTGAGTLAYSSPEQLHGETIDTASDIFQLGICLYELCTSQKPFGKTREQITKNLQNPSPTPAHEINAQVSKSLSAVVGKCLKGKKENRYPTASALKEDLIRCINHQPVAAPISWQTKTALYVRRNWMVLCLSLVLFSTILIAFLIYKKQADRIFEEHQKAQATLTFLRKVFDGGDPNLPASKDLTPADLLKKRADDIAKIKEPSVRAYVSTELARLYHKLGLWTEASPLLINAVSFYQQSPSEHATSLGRTLTELSANYRNLSQFDKADSTLSHAIDLLTKNLPETALPLAYALKDKSYLCYKRAAYEDGISSAHRAIALLENAPTTPSSEPPIEIALAFAYNNLSLNLRELSLYDDALKACQKALSTGEHFFEHDNTVRFIPLGNLAIIYNRMGNYEHQIKILHQKLIEEKEYFAEDNPQLINTIANLGAAYYKTGNYHRSDSLNLIAYHKYKNLYGKEHHHSISSLYNLGNSKYSQGQFGEAIGYFEQVLKVDIRQFGADHPYVAGDYISLGLATEGEKNYAQAEKYYHQALSIYQNKFGKNHQKVSYTHYLLAELHGVTGNLPSAEKHYKTAIEIGQNVLDDKHPELIKYHEGLSSLLKKQSI